MPTQPNEPVEEFLQRLLTIEPSLSDQQIDDLRRLLDPDEAK